MIYVSRRLLITCLLLVSACVVAGIWGLRSGAVTLETSQVFAALMGDAPRSMTMVVTEWRLPRVLMALLIGAALLTSSLTAVFRDFGELLQPLMRLLFYVSSVVWAIDGLSPGLQRVMRLNPLVYIIEGYRKCLLYGEGFWSSPGQGAYFWLAALALLAAGCTMHMRLRNRFIDQL